MPKAKSLEERRTAGTRQVSQRPASDELERLLAAVERLLAADCPDEYAAAHLPKEGE
jgi:hypothetical protein